MFAAPPGLKQPQRRAIIPARLACFVDEQCGDTLNMSSNYPSTPPPPLRPPRREGGEEGRGRVTWQPLCGGAGSQGELITLPSLSVASFPLQTNETRCGGLWARSREHHPHPTYKSGGAPADSLDTAAVAQ